MKASTKVLIVSFRKYRERYPVLKHKGTVLGDRWRRVRAEQLASTRRAINFVRAGKRPA